METFLRQWRKDSAERHQYDAAIYVGDKLLALTNADDDALALAHVHFAAGHYTRAQALVGRGELVRRSPAARHLAALCHIRQQRHDEALALLGERNPTHLIVRRDAARRKIQHHRRGERADRSEERDAEGRETLRYEAGMCYLRGLCYAAANAFERAKECYKVAVRIDVLCFEALDQLMQNRLMSPAEEWAFIESLSFDAVAVTSDADGNGPGGVPEAADFVRNLYITRLSTYARPADFRAALDTLGTHYHLADNADLRLARADVLFTASRFAPALALTSAVLDADPYNFAAIPLHLALLTQLGHISALFALAHDLADTHPQEPCTWLAVGTYYLATGRIPEARSYFSKASLLDPHFGPAWIGFAHTFAAEGEGDQAIAAYSTAARLFPGTHLPQLFLGMQELALDNLVIAREYLTAAYALCDRDPLLLNEIGVCCYKEEQWESAIRHFELALRIVEDDVEEDFNSALSQYQHPRQQHYETRLNLAHALRKAGRIHEALDQFDEVLRLGHRDCNVFASKGLVLLELERAFEATVALHEGLAMSPQDPLASELLAKALSLLEAEGVLRGADEEQIDVGMRDLLVKLRQRRMNGGAGRRKRGTEASDRMDLDGAIVAPD